MKNKFTSGLCVMMCLMIVLSMFAACSIKDKNTDNTTTALSPDNQWYVGNGTYEPVILDGFELADLVNEALGEEAKDFKGDLNTLTPEQIQKVENLAADKGLIIDKDEGGNTVIKEFEVPTTQATPEEFSQIMNQASVVNPSNVTPSQYQEISKVANDNGMVAVTKPSTGEVQVIKPITTAPVQNNTVPSTNIVITPTGTSVVVNPTTARPTVVNPTVNGTTNPAYTSMVTVPSSQSTTHHTAPTDPVVTSKTTRPSGNTTYATAPTYTAGSTMGTTKPMPLASSQWVNTFGGSSNDLFASVASTADGGAVAVGVTFSPEGRRPEANQKGTCGIIVKYNEKGKLQWNKLYDSDDSVTFEDVAVLGDGSMIVVGYTSATDFFSPAEYKCSGTTEGVIIKLNSKGEEIWRKALGGSATDLIYSVYPMSDGGFVVGGKSESTDSDLKNIGTQLRKAFVFRYDASGNIVWKQALSGSKHCSVDDLAVNPAGEVYAIISNASADGEFADLEGAKTGRRTAVVMKLGNGGNILWKKLFYDTGATNIQSITVSADGGCVIAGNYSSGTGGNEYSFKGIYNGGAAGTFDGMIIKIDTAGVTKWTLPLIGFENDYVTDITKIDGGYAVSGYTASSNRDFAITGRGNYDSFIYTITEYGKTKNVYSFGGSYSDNARAICSNGGSLYVAGSTNSADVYFANCEKKAAEKAAMAYVCRFEFDN